MYTRAFPGIVRWHTGGWQRRLLYSQEAIPEAKRQSVRNRVEIIIVSSNNALNPAVGKEETERQTDG